VIRSEDNGENWEDVTNMGAMGDANDIFLLSETEAYVAKDNNGIYHTTDGGQNWDNLTFTTGNWYLGIAILQDKNIWIVGSPNAGNTPSNIIYSSNGGNDWLVQTPQILEDNMAIGLYKVRFYEYYE